MLICPPPGYLTLDEMFSRVGSEIFGSEWSGRQASAVMTRPPEYWRDLKTLLTPEVAADQNGWSEHELKKHLADKEAANRYQYVTKEIIALCQAGGWLAFMASPSGEFSRVDKNGLNSEPFQRMISYPGEGDRDRVYFVRREDIRTDTETRLDTEAADRGAGQSAAQSRAGTDANGPGMAAEAPPASKRELRKQATQKMYATWFELAKKLALTVDGTTGKHRKIAKMVAEVSAASHPQTHKAPKPETVVRRLNKDHPGWAEKK